MARSGAIRLRGLSLIGFVTLAFAQQQPPPPVPAEAPRDQRQPPPPVPAGEASRLEPQTGQDDAEPLVHGPVHEAFAAPTAREPQPPPKLSDLPPQAPQEFPPPVAPEQDSEVARWIPGYWGWDARDQGYVWVSGTWRAAPPEMEWVPGYWATTEGNCRWVAGFWARRGEEELAYLPPPPAPQNEPPPPSPGANHFWVPGNWQYVEGEYRWKAGFWSEDRDDWVWTPDCYSWTPRGYVFMRGYWDLPLERRGLLFAPLKLKHDLVRRVSPTVLIDIRQALVHWFVAPTYRHYCFGDYYAITRGLPVVSWYEYGTTGPQYDAMLAYYSTHNAQSFGALKAKHKQCFVNASYRPPLVWSSYGRSNMGGLAYSIAGAQVPAGVVPFDFGAEFTNVLGYYSSVLSQRAQFERGAAVVAGRAPVFVQLDSFLPPGHGGLPPGLAKKGLIPPGFGGAPPGQAKKYIESFGPIAEKPGKGKGGGGKGKGKGR